ncbi:uncharacterized protein LOC128887264 [Hylaeus anthracinus]|uniref:uncharacterized protein LOC128887264 n=1 Tax=Hylaeus anthracinus TaxID=313031 RepID=UPI0023BA3B62|nr:uncharacterized protein LOC128887264 [Hylaeus anthracinus]
MLLESISSCSYLLLTCGSCIYSLIKHSYDQYQQFIPHFVCACSGIVMISTRSMFVLVYKLFIKQYVFDPVIIELEEKRNKGRLNSVDELFGIFSMAALLYSIYCHHEYYLLGACIITSLSLLDIFKLYKLKEAQLQGTDVPRSENIVARMLLQAPRCTIFIRVLISGHFAYSVGNNYAFVANYPYLLTTWTLPPEGFYQGWSLRRTINDYMMAAYVIYMTEALRQT